MGRIQGDLKDRTFHFALSILDLADVLPSGNKGWIVGKQLIRSGTSIGANIREADQAFSTTDFAFKCSLALKEASETEYWLQMAIQSDLLTHEVASPLTIEIDELIRILNAIVKRTQQSCGPQ